MLKDVVQVCTDGSDLSHKGIESAVEIAKALHLPVVGMTAVLSKPNTVHGLEHEDKAVQERLAAVKNLAEAAEIPYELVAEHCESVADGILNVADRHDARFIVMASRGLGTLGSLILGSETQKVLAQADRPVLVIRSAFFGLKAAAASAELSPRMRTRFVREVSPLMTATADFGTPAVSAMKRISMALALPSTGGADRAILSLSL